VAAQEHPIDICNVCHVSYYVNEMREEEPVRHLRLVKG